MIATPPFLPFLPFTPKVPVGLLQQTLRPSAPSLLVTTAWSKEVALVSHAAIQFACRCRSRGTALATADALIIVKIVVSRGVARLGLLRSI